MDTYRFFIVFLIAYVTFGASATNSNGFGQYTLCATDECINAASEILAKLNRTVDPCDDFYQFACGGWLQTNQPNQSFPKVDCFSVLTNKAQNHLREILEAPVKQNDTMSLQKAKHIFAQCMGKDSETVVRSNLSAIVNSYGGWPMVLSLHEWSTKNLTWQNISTILHRNTFDNGIYQIDVFVDSRMSNSNVIHIVDPLLSYPRDEMIQMNNTQQLKNGLISQIVSVAKKLIKETNRTEMNNFTQDALDIIHFEMELANLTSPLETIMDVDQYYIPLTIQQLQVEYDKQQPEMKGKIDWHSAIQEVFASEGITIEPAEKLVVPAYKYLTNLVPLLERTPSRTIVNFMQWTILKKLIKYNKQPNANSTARVIQHSNAVDKQMEGKDTRWKNCISTVNLKSAISHEYIKKYILLENIENIREIRTDVESAVRQQIQNVTWMDEPTRVASLEKLAHMNYAFFKPDWYSDEAIDRYYENLNVSMGYLDNIINILKFKNKKKMNSLRTLVNKDKWFLEPTVPEAYNTPFYNKIVVTAALLQSPIYDRNRVALMNYGTLGFSIAHEINHAFDTQCRKFDKDGNAVQWWTQEAINNYNNITQCFVDQYNEYLVPGFKNIRVNGQRSLGESIGDSGGIVAAYYAYKNRKARLNETDWRLQGLEDYSEDQILFLTYAQLFCETALPERIEEDIILDPFHPLKEIRIRGSLSNSREFSETYNCSLGSRMNPEKKCVLWY
ncbi:neprilysin-like [Pseudomyrmex gracilis]|uniref:neprilysin-like n=1 Tax=Pseudomyrmex gracilis TaxID=219809 RepID=UPI0009959AAE|nr:neprilysin-like [Pseudomyrmex gracilis]XP_020296571.1 neprilysin-like [Pseudomyrmex gracilis]